MLEFDEYGKLLNESEALVGKTIAKVEAICSWDDPYEGQEKDAWLITFTDRTAVELIARYDDSDVTFRISRGSRILGASTASGDGGSKEKS